MSQKTAKKLRKDFELRKDAFLKGMTELSRVHKIGLAPVLQYNATGVIAAMSIVDESKEYENITPEAQKQNELEEKKKSEEAKKRLAPKIQPA